MYFNIAERILNQTLGKNHELISGYSTDVQQLLNDQANLKLAVQAPELNKDRIDGFVNKLSVAEDFADVAWVLDDPIINFCQSIVDDAIEKNAKFQFNAGLNPKINRRLGAYDACKWCTDLAGTYDYYDLPDEIYLRHQRCRCTVDYHPGDGRKQDVWSKAWREKANSAKIETRKQIGIPSASGENAFKKAFTKTNLDRHYEKHGIKEYPELTKRQYNDYALELVQSAIGDDILGYKTNSGAIVRYKVTSNDFVKGYPNSGIATLFKPKNSNESGHRYYKRLEELEGIKDD